MNRLQFKMDSIIGPLYLVASEKGLQGVFWKEQEVPYIEKEKNPPARFIKQAQKQIEEYLDGKRREFDLPLDPIGTEFQKRVWRELGKIPYGKTCSYKDIAIKLKNEKACRAVGTANGQNPLSLIVPCHRVIASNGALAGYAGGLERKKKLLELEKLN